LQGTFGRFFEKKLRKKLIKRVTLFINTKLMQNKKLSSMFAPVGEAISLPRAAGCRPYSIKNFCKTNMCYLCSHDVLRSDG